MSKPAQRTCHGKARYRTRALAEAIRRKQQAKRGEPLRVYGCPDCGGFHLTGKLRRFQERGR